MKQAWMLGAAIAFAAPLFTVVPLAAADNAPRYTEEGRLQAPINYREWIYLTSGFNMSYAEAQPGAAAGSPSRFDNVFASPEAYRSFQQTGTWPDKTVLVLEVRAAGSNASINKQGHFQTGERFALEVHVKDVERFPGDWAFFGFTGDEPAKMIAMTAQCYSCHLQHGAVDTTFVQFYPTLLPIAEAKQTFRSRR
jgi:hypothetical protein